jgi:hypothetical protein
MASLSSRHLGGFCVFRRVAEKLEPRKAAASSVSAMSEPDVATPKA